MLGNSLSSRGGAEWRIESATGLHLTITDRGDSDVFGRFFEHYDRAFVLPNEKEDIEGFRTCLALNHGVEYRRREFRASIQYS
jgi:hypothetical protein